ncbi:hypothetical protein [Methylobacter sp. BBA5.1]|uniref:hypothetical protein n=1 Tax=Methylobacter sp. BBA5.1 TaxID=1495064 RepID=UPI00056AC109|nr:hypothetical protein [Methylobacter sp. BBA5.1]
MLDINNDELLALHRYIIETKFSVNAKEIAFSPLLSQIANKVLDSIIADTAKQDSNAAVQWKNWRVLTKTRPEWNFVKEKISQEKYWSNLKSHEKINHLRIIASPYIIPDEMIREIVYGEMDEL